MFAAFWNSMSLGLNLVDFGVSGGRLRPASARGEAPRRAAATEPRPPDEGLESAEMSLEQMDGAQRDWADLAARALEPNAFYEPGFALAAARHFPLNARPRFIVVWEKGPDGARRMMGLFPIVTPSPLFGDGFIRLWLHKQAALATPLVDRDRAAEALHAFLDWIEARRFAAGVVFSRMPQNGRCHAALAQAAAARGRCARILLSYERAALLPGGDAEALCARAASKKKLAEMRRQRRRLGEMGRLAFESARTPEAVRLATEEFLTLEAAGWKAGRGALLSQASLTTFLRSATRMLAREERCIIQSLRLDGRPIAMLILLESQGRAYCWKIAFDETFRSQAPGFQLIWEQTKTQLARTDLEVTDSCAIANHPMIDKLWPDRIGVCDVAVQLQAGRERLFLAKCQRERARRNIRDFARRARNRLLKRKVN